MSVVSERPMSLLHVEFDELYARHLCRHSQFGINVVHLAALFGIWYAVYAIVYRLTGTFWAPVALAAAYLAVLAPTVPARVLAATGLFVGVLVVALLPLADLPHWAVALLLLAIPLCYKLQAQSHKWFPVERDMTEFNKKYRKGFVLFVVLLFAEVPIALNYLVFDRKN